VKVIIPYIPGMLDERTVPAVVAQGYVPMMMPHPDVTYGVVLAQVATWDEDVAIVEQDKESRTGLLHAFEDCPEPYCWNVYPVHGEIDIHTAGTGHCRLRREAWAVLRDKPLPQCTYRSGIDSQIQQWLEEAGITAHLHPEMIVHHHPSSASTLHDV
jgi:hypothetical protein